MNIKPVTPDEVLARFFQPLPDFVIRAVDCLLRKCATLPDARAVIDADELRRAMGALDSDFASKLPADWVRMMEAAYKTAGWEVECDFWTDKPYFTFRRAR